MWETRGRLLSEVFERKADYFILTTSSEKNYSFFAPRIEKKYTKYFEITLSWKLSRFFCAAYHIYLINRPGHLLNFWTLRVGTYLRWVLIRGWALIKFPPFSASEECLFCNETINAIKT